MWDSMKVIEWFEKVYPDYMLMISSDYMYDKTKIKIMRIKDSLNIGTVEFGLHDEVSFETIKDKIRHILSTYHNLTITQKIVNPDNSLNNKCPNCGAHHNGYKCEYCDTVFVSNICTDSLRQEYINECYKLACQEQDLEMRKIMGFFDYQLPKHLL